MRISTAALHAQGVNNILLNQTALAKTQNELALGTRMVTARDDPAGFARAQGLDQQLAQIERYRGNGAVALHHLGLEESALVSVNETLNRVRELALQAQTASSSAESRNSAAQEIRLRLDELLSVANSTDGEGRYLFGGNADASAPFSLNASGATYSGGAAVRLLDIGGGRSVALGDSGAAVFQNLRSGNGTFAVGVDSNNAGTAKLDAAKLSDPNAWVADTYTISFNAGAYEVRDSGGGLVDGGAYQSGTAIRFRGADLTFSGTPADGDTFTVAPSQSQDMFATLQKMAALIESTPTDAAGRARQQTAFFAAFTELDAALQHTSGVRATVGHRLSALDSASAQLDTLDVQAQTTLSGLRDVDYAEATARLNLQMTALQAAQQSYARIQGLSLFDYLR